MSYTPGPWEIGPINLDYALGPPGEIAIRKQFKAGDVLHSKKCMKDGSIGIAVALPFGHQGDKMPEMTAANARLIASAPSLLAALKQIAELEGDCEQQNFKLTRFQAAQIARAAIAKGGTT